MKTNPAAGPWTLGPLPGAVALALLALTPQWAAAQSNADILNELNALKARITELEKKLRQAEQAPATRGLTPEQQAEMNRVTVKTEALEDARDAAGFKGLKISGYMDPSFIYNKAQDRAGFQFLNRVNDDSYNYDNSYFGAAVIDFIKETDSGTRWRLTLAPNRGAGSVFDQISPIHEASVSMPLSDLQTRFIAGQLPDWSGYEYLQPTLNKLITHNMLFDFTLPTAYTGAGLDITRGKWIYKGLLANMNASKKPQGNKSPAFAYRVDYARGEFQGFGFAGVLGKAPNLRADETDATTGALLFPNDAGRDTALGLFEFDAYFIRGDFTWQGQLSYGTQKKAAITPDPVSGELRDATWAGLSTLVAYKFEPRLEGVVRLDYIQNKKNGGGLLGFGSLKGDGRNGIGAVPADRGGDPEVGANRTALSLGMNYLFNLNTTFKAEYRLDRANLAVFENVKDGTFRKSNQVLGASMVVSF
ncbi:MAG TPA: DUF3138 family protein [Burkholderiaceae bacterium]|nr:DUF3138 family protein [Burkholderiaceae bacterium]